MDHALRFGGNLVLEAPDEIDDGISGLAVIRTWSRLADRVFQMYKDVVLGCRNSSGYAERLPQDQLDHFTTNSHNDPPSKIVRETPSQSPPKRGRGIPPPPPNGEREFPSSPLRGGLRRGLLTAFSSISAETKGFMPDSFENTLSTAVMLSEAKHLSRV